MLIIAGSILVACGSPQNEKATSEDKKQEQPVKKVDEAKNNDQAANEDKNKTEADATEKEQPEPQTAPEPQIDVEVKTETANEIAMSVVDIISTPQKNDTSVELVFDIKNNNKTEQGVGANDYRIKDDKGKEYRIDGARANFGDAIKPNQILTGSAFFVLPKAVKNFTLVYQPADKVEAEWKLELK